MARIFRKTLKFNSTKRRNSTEENEETAENRLEEHKEEEKLRKEKRFIKFWLNCTIIGVRKIYARGKAKSGSSSHFIDVKCFKGKKIKKLANARKTSIVSK